MAAELINGEVIDDETWNFVRAELETGEPFKRLLS